MKLRIARTAMVVASSAGLVLGAATSAGAGGHDQDHNRHRGWVNVCQNIHEDHGDHGDHGKAKDRRAYHGAYKVVDSSYRTQYVDLWGRYDCDQVEVRSGDVRVTVVYEPDHTRLRSDYSKSVYVGRNQYRTVTFYYEARGHDRDHAAYSRTA